ncbi:MAG: hypothetical protein JSU08_17335 [Acidobacteria bacterium]|nr:hypothetical protein [Acidobacteriota bacterium]
MTEPTLTPSRLWRRMTADQRLRAARAFWADEQAGDDQVQAALLIAQHKKFRPKFIMSMDDDRRSKHLASLLTLPEALAARCLVVYHLTEQREMMGTFLDELGLKHEAGLIEDDDAKPDPEKIGPAVAAIEGKYPAEDVSLYLTTLLCQDPDTWGGLAGLPQIMK